MKNCCFLCISVVGIGQPFIQLGHVERVVGTYTFCKYGCNCKQYRCSQTKYLGNQSRLDISFLFYRYQIKFRLTVSMSTLSALSLSIN